MSENLFDSYMIVYSKNELRRKNYDDINKLFKNKLNYFEAIDTINNFEFWKSYSIKNNYSSEKYINTEVKTNGKGKLGCNLSHYLLFKQIYEIYNINKNIDKKNKIIDKNKNTEDNKNNQDNQTNKDWFLILEDDVGINPKKDLQLFVNKIINHLDKYLKATKYVQLCIYPQFLINQTKTPKLLSVDGGEGFIKIPQYGTCAYLIHIDAIKTMLNIKPWDSNIDFLFNKYDKTFNSIAVLNHIFTSKGSCDSTDSNSEFGSLIWENK